MEGRKRKRGERLRDGDIGKWDADKERVDIYMEEEGGKRKSMQNMPEADPPPDVTRKVTSRSVLPLNSTTHTLNIPPSDTKYSAWFSRMVSSACV